MLPRSYGGQAWKPEPDKLGPSRAWLSPQATSPTPQRVPSKHPVSMPAPFLFFLPASTTRLDFLVNFLLMTSNFAWLDRGEKEVSPSGSGLGERARGPAWAWQGAAKSARMQGGAPVISGIFQPEQSLTPCGGEARAYRGVRGAMATPYYLGCPAPLCGGRMWGKLAH